MLGGSDSSNGEGSTAAVAVRPRRRIGRSRAGPIAWQGRLLAVQPRLRQVVSGATSQQAFVGYHLVLRNAAGQLFTVEVASGRLGSEPLRPGDLVSGRADPCRGPLPRAADLCRPGGLRIVARPLEPTNGPGTCPRRAIPNAGRDHSPRPLAADRYAETCHACCFGCVTVSEAIPDPARRDRVRTLEHLCFGPDSCAMYDEPLSPRRSEPRVAVR